tara:strand:+ start:1263 stop:1970 length:708 start_codon:yes stop_codon:yes gene_type:complete
MDLHFSIGPDKYQVPKHITVGVFERAIGWDISEPKNLKPFTATIVGCPLTALDILDVDVAEFITAICLQRMQLDEGTLQKEIDGFKIIDFDTMTFANFIDLDTYTSSGIGANLSNIVAVLYDAPKETVLEWDAVLIWPAILLLTKFRQSVYREYDEFFELGDQKEASDEAKESNIQLMWWEAIMALADEVFLHIHQVVERPYKECLNYLTWKKSKAQKEKLNNLRIKNDIQKRSR